MAKIKIAGVKSGTEGYTVHVVLTEQQEVEGRMMDMPLGEAFVTIPLGIKTAKAKSQITDTANKIMDAHKNAQKLRKDIEELEFPEIT